MNAQLARLTTTVTLYPRIVYRVKDRKRRGWLTHDVMMVLITAPLPLGRKAVTEVYCARHGVTFSRGVQHLVDRVLRHAVALGRATRTGRGSRTAPFKYEAVKS